MLAGPLLSRAFSPRSCRLLYRQPPLMSLHPSVADRGRPPSYARAHSPAPLVLSPGIYNTLCFPSAICLGSSAPSLTLLSRVLFLFNSAVSFRIPPPPCSRRALVTYPPRTLTSGRLVESGRFFVSSRLNHPDPRDRRCRVLQKFAHADINTEENDNPPLWIPKRVVFLNSCYCNALKVCASEKQVEEG